MPLVRISLIKGGPAGFGGSVGKVVHQAMVDTIGIPASDRFQIITEHEASHLVYDPHYLDIPRTDGIVFVQITLNEGRTADVKKALYKAIVEGLNKELGVRTEDVVISLVDVKRENWSFGNGLAQFAL